MHGPTHVRVNYYIHFPYSKQQAVLISNKYRFTLQTEPTCAIYRILYRDHPLPRHDNTHTTSGYTPYYATIYDDATYAPETPHTPNPLPSTLRTDTLPAHYNNVNVVRHTITQRRGRDVQWGILQFSSTSSLFTEQKHPTSLLRGTHHCPLPAARNPIPK